MFATANVSPFMRQATIKSRWNALGHGFYQLDGPFHQDDKIRFGVPDRASTVQR
jgi:hypothetical protein